MHNVQQKALYTKQNLLKIKKSNNLKFKKYKKTPTTINKI